MPGESKTFLKCFVGRMMEMIQTPGKSTKLIHFVIKSMADETKILIYQARAAKLPSFGRGAAASAMR